MKFTSVVLLLLTVAGLSQTTYAENQNSLRQRSCEADLTRLSVTLPEPENVLEEISPVHDLLHGKKVVSFYGSARVADPRVQEVARLLGLEDFAIVSGGGGGVMESAARGAKESNTLSVGLNIQLPFEQKPSSFLDHVYTFDNFFTRKLNMRRYSQALVVGPGGFGTLDELSELITLIQTKKIKPVPLIFIGTEFYKPFVDWLTNTMVKEGTLSPEDLKIFHVTDDPKEAVQIIKSYLDSTGHDPQHTVYTDTDIVNKKNVMKEFRLVERISREIKDAVTIFGSARIASPQGEKLAEILSSRGLNIITGGGNGAMESGNKGAKKGKGQSIGINIELPFEQKPNIYIDKLYSFKNFFLRKLGLRVASQAFVVVPGGIGTIDEFAEIITLMQTAKMKHLPFILMGKDYYAPFVKWIQDVMMPQKMISPEDLKLFYVTDSPEEAADIILKSMGK